MKKLMVLLCSVLLVFGIAGTAGANLLVNGDFETGDLTGWTSDDVNVVDIGGVYGNVAVFDEDNSSGIAYLYQDFYINPDVDYVKISFDYMFVEDQTINRSDWFSSNFSFAIDSFPYVNNYSLTYNETTTGVVEFSAVYDLTSISDWGGLLSENASISFTLREQRRGNESLAFLDNVNIAPVPEPATMLLLGTGLLGLAVVGRKKIKK